MFIVANGHRPDDWETYFLNISLIVLTDQDSEFCYTIITSQVL